MLEPKFTFQFAQWAKIVDQIKPECLNTPHLFTRVSVFRQRIEWPKYQRGVLTPLRNPFNTAF